MGKKINKNVLFFLSIQIIILFFLILNYEVHDIVFVDIIKIYLYQFFSWFLVGLVIIDLLKIISKNLAETVALSYAFGAIFSIILYLLFMIPKMGQLLPYITTLEGIFCVLYLYKKGISIHQYDISWFDIVLCLVFLSIYYLITLFAVSFVNTMPNELSNGVGYHPDWSFWAGNNIAFTKSFPNDNFRQIGREFKYHYFSSLLMAQISLCTRVAINQITFYFSSIFSGLVFVFCGYYFVTRLIVNKWLIALSMLIILFTGGTTSSTVWHTIICPFGFDYGYSYGMLSIAILVDIIHKKHLYELMLPSCFALAMTVGSKGPVGIIVLACYGTTSLIYLLKRKYKAGFVSGSAWLSSFFAVYYIFINDTWTTTSSAGLKFIGGLGINSIVTRAPYISMVYEEVLSAYRITGEWLPIKIYAIFLYLLRTNKVVMTLFMISIIKIIIDLIRKEAKKEILYVMTVGSITAILLGIYTAQIGGSQIYFIEAMFSIAVLSGIYSLEDELLIVKENKGYTFGGNVAIIAVIFSLGISVSCCYNTIMEKVREGIGVVRNKYGIEDYYRGYLDTIDYQVFEWLCENTDSNCIVATNSFKDIEDRDSPMLMGVFSQRFIWNEQYYVFDYEESERRNQIVKKFIQSPIDYLENLKSEGVNYFVYRVQYEGVNSLSACGLLEALYENSRYVVYKVLD